MRLRVNPEHRKVRSFGFRVGYWYCIPSPFLQVNVGRRYWSFWVERGEHRWTPAELSADRRVEPTPLTKCGSKSEYYGPGGSWLNCHLKFGHEGPHENLWRADK